MSGRNTKLTFNTPSKFLESELSSEKEGEELNSYLFLSPQDRKATQRSKDEEETRITS